MKSRKKEDRFKYKPVVPMLKRTAAVDSNMLSEDQKDQVIWEGHCQLQYHLGEPDLPQMNQWLALTVKLIEH